MNQSTGTSNHVTNVRNTLNFLILIICTTVLGLVLYIMINFKKILEKILCIGLNVIHENKSIQPTLSDFADTTINTVLNNKKIKTTLQNTATDMLVNILNSNNLDTALSSQFDRIIGLDTTEQAVANLIQSPPVKTSLTNIIVKPLKSTIPSPNSSFQNSSFP